jgi:gliding motility-associated-like protein
MTNLSKCFILFAGMVLYAIQPAQAQVTAGDCNIAVNICTNASFTISPNGLGAIDELIGNNISNPQTNPASANAGCLLGGEINSTWMIINIASNGILEFSFGAAGGGSCYDWIMWPYTPTTCADIQGNTLPPVRCNWNGACGGYTGCATTVPTGGDPSDFEPALPVLCGEKYIVCFSNWSSSSTTVPLNFFGSANVSCNTFSPIFVNDTTICQGGTATLTATGGNTYTWTPNATLTVINDSTATANPTVTTDYIVTGAGACGTGEDTATVTVAPAVVATVSTTDESCAGVSDGTLTVTVTSGGIAPLNFTITGPTTSTNATGVFTNVPGGAYTIDIIDDLGCQVTLNATVNQASPMSMTFNVTDAICKDSCNGTANVTVVGGALPYTYNWSNGIAGTGDNLAINLCDGTYDLTITDDNGCTVDTIGFPIIEPPALLINSVTTTEETCGGDCDGTITIDALNATLFSIDNGATFTAATNYIDLCTGNYDIIVQDAAGCLAMDNAVITGLPQVLANFAFGPQPTTINNTAIRFTNTSLNAVSYEWDFAGLGTSTDVNPTFEFPDQLANSYIVCLVAMNANGCTDTTCSTVIINDEFLIYVPNAFTPDGDGINDFFFPVLNAYDVNDLTFQIFDRWGELIFESDSPSNPWDGSVKGAAEMAADGVYVWKISAKDEFTREKKEFIGHVTLIR